MVCEEVVFERRLIFHLLFDIGKGASGANDRSGLFQHARWVYGEEPEFDPAR